MENRLCWSNENEGYSFFMDKKGCVVYETGKHMKGSDIAKYLKISRSAVSQSLKRSLSTIYYYLKKESKFKLSPVEIAFYLAEMFEVKTENQYRKFFNLFPSDIKGEIYSDACEYGYR